MLKINNPDKFFYHEEGKLKITALNVTKITIGTKCRIKEAKDGFNHPDLANGAIAYFFSWPPQKTIILQTGETFIIDEFVAYQIKGDHTTEGVCHGKNKFFVS
jgi:hypothetical protein